MPCRHQPGGRCPVICPLSLQSRPFDLGRRAKRREKITDSLACLGAAVLCWAPELRLSGCRAPLRIAAPLCLAPCSQAARAARPPSPPLVDRRAHMALTSAVWQSSQRKDRSRWSLLILNEGPPLPEAGLKHGTRAPTGGKGFQHWRGDNLGLGIWSPCPPRRSSPQCLCMALG